MPSFCLFCRAPPRPNRLAMRWLVGDFASSWNHRLARLRVYKAGLWAYSGYVHHCCLNCARPTNDPSHHRFAGPDAACDATGVYVCEVLMLREHSDV